MQWVLHRRMGARQQMRWSPRGAHLMLQVRTAIVNGTLDGSGANKVQIDAGLPGLRQGPFYAAASTAFQTAGVLLSLRRSLSRLNCSL